MSYINSPIVAGLEKWSDLANVLLDETASRGNAERVCFCAVPAVQYIIHAPFPLQASWPAVVTTAYILSIAPQQLLLTHGLLRRNL